MPGEGNCAGHSVSIERERPAQILPEIAIQNARADRADHGIEQTMGKLKRFKRVAMRCEKTKASFEAFVSFACVLILVKSVHTA